MNTQEPAFPVFAHDAASNNVCYDKGMTIRDYFAAQAMIGICINEHDIDISDTAEAVAKLSYRLADAMLEARKK